MVVRPIKFYAFGSLFYRPLFLDKYLHYVLQLLRQAWEALILYIYWWKYAYVDITTFENYKLLVLSIYNMDFTIS